MSNAWPAERREQLMRLERLLYRCSSVNSSAPVADNLLHIELESENLIQTDFENEKQSFIHWLGEIALGDADE